MNDYLVTMRLHLIDRLNFTVMPWLILGITFVVNYAIFAMMPLDGGTYSGGVLSLPAYMTALGAITLTRSMPFATMLSITRRRFFLGSAAVAVGICVAGAIGVTALNFVERATGGWGVDLHFFRLFEILDGPWWQVFVVCLTFLLLCFATGLWVGLIYRSWAMTGIGTAVGILGFVAVGLGWIVTVSHGWHGVGAFFSTDTANHMILLSLVATAILGLGGYATIRRTAA